jgi:hypothetical protein
MALTTTSIFNPVLSEMLNKIGENRFVGTQILPIRNVGLSNGQYPVFNAEVFDNDASKARAPGSKAARIDFGYGQQDYACKQYMLEAPLPDEDANKASQDGIDDVTAALAMKLQRNLMVGHERRVASIVYNAGFNSTEQTGAAMSTSATAKPIVTIQNAVERLNANGFYDNLALIIETSLYNELLNTDDVRDIFNGAGIYNNRQVLLDALGVNQIILCPTRFNAAAKGQNASRSKIWPDDKYLVAQVGGGDFANGGFGRTLAYSPDGGAFTAETYREESVKSDILRVYNSVDEVVINTNAGELITTA